MPLMRTGTVNFMINKIPVIRQGFNRRNSYARIIAQSIQQLKLQGIAFASN